MCLGPTGDTSSTASALCYSVSKSAQGSSLHALESGSDFKSRGMSRDNRVIFGPGVSMSSCDVRLIDDSEYELSEEFELVLSDPSDNTRIGDVSVAKVVIDGPNDASKVFLGNSSFTFSEDAGMCLQNYSIHFCTFSQMQLSEYSLLIFCSQVPLRSLFTGMAVICRRWSLCGVPPDPQSLPLPLLV